MERYCYSLLCQLIILQDKKSVIHRVANFLEKSLSDDQVKQLVDHLSFERMKENSAVNMSSYLNFMRKYGLIPHKNGNFIRSGKIDEWEEAMDAKLVQRFEKWEQENLKNADQTLVEFFNYST